MQTFLVFIVILSSFTLKSYSQSTTATISYGPDPSRIEVGDSLRIICSTRPLLDSEFLSAKVQTRLAKTILEVDGSSQVVVRDIRPSSGYVNASVSLSMGVITFTVFNITVNDSNWSSLRCQISISVMNNIVDVNSEIRSFDVVASVGVPNVWWNESLVVESTDMPLVTCSANVGFPSQFASINLVHMTENGTLLNDVRVADSRTTRELDRTYRFDVVYQIGCSEATGMCTRLTKWNHGDWFICTAQNPNGTRAVSNVIRRQLRVIHRTSTVRVFDSAGNALVGRKVTPSEIMVDIVDVLNVTPLPEHIGQSLEYVCVADGEPRPTVNWIGKPGNLATIVPGANYSVLRLNPSSKPSIDIFECEAHQNYPLSTPVRRIARLTFNFTAGAIQVLGIKDNRLLIIGISAGATAVVITIIVSIVVGRRLFGSKARSTGSSSRRNRAPNRKSEMISEVQNRTPPAIQTDGFDTLSNGLDLALNTQFDDKPRSRKPIVEVEDGFKDYPYPQQTNPNMYVISGIVGDVNGNTLSPPTATIIAPGSSQFRSPFLNADSL